MTEMVSIFFFCSFVIVPCMYDALFSLSFAVGDNKLLRLLLSFAVGGLLGDVFLHLLPEAWNNIEYCKLHLMCSFWMSVLM